MRLSQAPSAVFRSISFALGFLCASVSLAADGLPILGADPQIPALCYACGFSRNGILLAPWAAEQLLPLLMGGTLTAAAAPFSVERIG